MNFMTAIDTNIWVYSHDVRDVVKQERARELIGACDDLALLWQVGCEFMAASRKLAVVGFTREAGWAALRAMQEMAATLVLPAPADWVLAEELESANQIPLWDGLVIAACVRAGIRTRYSEDIHELGSGASPVIINPFKQPAAAGTS